MNTSSSTPFRATDIPNEAQIAIDTANARADNAVAHSKRVTESYRLMMLGMTYAFMILLFLLTARIYQLTRTRDDLVCSNKELRDRARDNWRVAVDRDPARGGRPIVDIWDERLTPPTVLVAERDLVEAALMAEMEHRYGSPRRSEDTFQQGRSESYLLNPTSPGQRPRRHHLVFDTNGCVARASIEYNRRLGIAVRSWNANEELCPGSSPPSSPAP